MYREKIITLREVCEDDAKMLWEWANDSEVRAASFSSTPITWEKHIQWLKSKLSSCLCIFFIAMNSDNIPIGQIRYDIANHEAIVSISIRKEFRGKGYGKMVIWLASQKLFTESNVSKIHAYIKPTNKASICAFLKAHFKNAGLTTINDQKAIHLVLVREDEV